MQSSNYPAGVTDAHPHFNEQEVEIEVKCGAEEMVLVPSYAVKAMLLQIRRNVDSFSPEQIKGALTDALDTVYGLEDNGTYDCPYDGTVTVAVSEEAEWDCDVCGTAHKIDTATPDEEDPRDR